MCTTQSIFQQLSDIKGSCCLAAFALHFKALQICFVLTEGRWWWEVWSDSLTLALWLRLCSGEPREWPEAAPTKCSPHVEDNPGIWANQISAFITPLTVQVLFGVYMCACLSACVFVSASCTTYCINSNNSVDVRIVCAFVLWGSDNSSDRWKGALCLTVIAIFIQLPVSTHTQTPLNISSCWLVVCKCS